MENDINNIIAKELAGEASAKELQLLQEWIKVSDTNLSQYQIIRLNWVQGNKQITASEERVYKRLSANLPEENPAQIPAAHGRGFAWRTYSRAAAVLLLIAGLTFVLIKSLNQDREHQAAATAQVVKQTPKGVKRQIKLPDGTMVWLNSNTRLSYPAHFSDTARSVDLTGEGYFEVKQDTSRPFRVRSGKLSTTALGTAFNINAFEGNMVTSVALIHGKIKVELISGEESVFLSPGYAVELDEQSSALNSRIVDLAAYTAWKDGIIIFTDASEQEVFKRLEDWYGVDILISSQYKSDWNLTTKFDNENLENVLNILAVKMQFEYEMKDKTIEIEYLKR